MPKTTAGGTGPRRSRPPTYGTATRLARIVHGLMERPLGWSFDAILAEMRISERTLLRYLAACRRELVDGRGRPVLEPVSRGGRRYLRLRRVDDAATAGVYDALLLYFALSLLEFLDGTVLRDGVQELWQRFARTVPSAQRVKLAHLDRKFYSIPYAVKDYRAHDETLNAALSCLVYQRVMRVRYDSPWLGDGDGAPHDFEPYTLAMYRGGLYLIGRSRKYRRIVYLAVERIRELSELEERFEYPARYSPAAWTEGTFGIVQGPETAVEIVIRSEEGKALLSARRLHPSQRFVRQRDGTTVLSMTVRGTEELKNWILSLGPHVEVRKPAALREEIARAAEGIAALHRGGSRGPRKASRGAR